MLTTTMNYNRINTSQWKNWKDNVNYGQNPAGDSTQVMT